MEAGPVLPLWLLQNYIVCYKYESTDTLVGWYYQGYVYPTLYVAARVVVGMLPLRSKAAGYVFKRSLHLHDKEATRLYEEKG